jgi:hypothetical protein
MKTSTILRLTTCVLLLTICVLLLATATHAQTIRRVNNNPGVTGINVYTTAQAAHDAAAANDILIVEPSVTNYGNLILTKPLKIYGNGYFLDTNTELKADLRTSGLGSIKFDTGSGGSTISGLVGSFNVYGVSNITIQRCNGGVSISASNVAGTTITNVSDIVISQNYFDGSVGAYIGTAGYTISNVLVSNNFLRDIDHNTNPGTYSNWIVRNNTFLNTSGVTAASRLVNSVFENNLIPFPPASGFSFAFTNVTFTNNVSYTTHFGTSNGNQANFAVTPELIGTGASISPDEAYQIKAGSALKTAGSAGTEVGAYGGATPYVVSGIPAIPSIVNMSNTATGSNTVPLNVTISVKSNN